MTRDGGRAKLVERIAALALMELGKIPDPRLAGLAGESVSAQRAALEAATNNPQRFASRSRILTDREAREALDAYIAQGGGLNTYYAQGG